MNMYDPNRRTPYIQNFNVSIQRELASGLVMDVSYIGSKGTALYGLLEQNNVKMIDNGFLNAFNVTRGGGDAPLFDQMLSGINFPGIGIVVRPDLPDPPHCAGTRIRERFWPMAVRAASPVS